MHRLGRLARPAAAQFSAADRFQRLPVLQRISTQTLRPADVQRIADGCQAPRSCATAMRGAAGRPAPVILMLK
jgi:hypothetical protein